MFTCPAPTTGGNLLGSCVLSCCLIRSSCQHLPVPSSPPSPPLPASTSPAHTIQWTNCHWPLRLSQLCIYVFFFYFRTFCFCFFLYRLHLHCMLWQSMQLTLAHHLHCIMCRPSVWGPASNGFVVTGVGGISTDWYHVQNMYTKVAWTDEAEMKHSDRPFDVH